jgi:DNA-binding MarR family transcriptional regulator
MSPACPEDELVAMQQLSGEVTAWLGMVENLDYLAFALVALTARAIYDVVGELPLLQWRALVELDAAGPLRLGELAARLPASTPSTSRLVKRMTKRDLIATRPVPTDGRGISVQLSPHGHSLQAAVIDRRRDLILDVLTSSSVPADLNTGLAVLGKRLRARTLASADSP